MRILYENVDWNEVKEFYLNLKSVRETQRVFDLGETTLKKFLIKEGVYDPLRKQKAARNKTPFNIGDKFHRWTVIGKYRIQDRRYVVPVQCECGTISTARLSHLLAGKNTGCKHCATKINYPSSRKMRSDIVTHKGVYNSWLTSIERNSKRGFIVTRDLEVSITLEDLYNQLEKQDFKCALTGIPLNVLDVNKNKSNASVDRRVNEIGYTKDNIQWVIKDVNLMKNRFNEDYFIEICNKITNFRNGNPDPSVSLND